MSRQLQGYFETILKLPRNYFRTYSRTLKDYSKKKLKDYSKALYEIKWAPYFHSYPDILKYDFQMFQQVSCNFYSWVELWCSKFGNMQNTQKIMDYTIISIVLQISLQWKHWSLYLKLTKKNFVKIHAHTCAQKVYLCTSLVLPVHAYSCLVHCACVWWSFRIFF